MSRVRIVTDSTADLFPQQLEEYKIGMVPLKVRFGEEVFRDGVDMTPEAFFEKLAVSTHHPSTSQPSPGEYAETYRRLLEEGAESIISIHLSSRLSGSFESARIARSMLEEADIEVVDSKLASMGYGLIVLEAARAAAQGAGKEEVLRLVTETLQRARIYFAVDTLEYLEKNGRIGRAQALLGSLLNIKPILTLDNDGYVAAREKVRGAKKVIPRLLEIIREHVPPGSRIRCAVVHGDAEDRALQVQAELEKTYQVDEVPLHWIGPVIGTHTGPGTLGIVYYPE